MKYHWFLKIVIYSSLLVFIGCYLTPRLVYPIPHREVPNSPPHGLSEKYLGNNYHAWISEPPQDNSPVLIWCHGNGDNLETMRRSALFSNLKKIGIGFIAMDYPGYGRSKGSPDQDGVVESVRLAILESKSRWPNHLIFLGGHSLGTGVAFQVSQNKDISGLITVCPFTSLQDAGREHYPNWLVKILSLLISDTYESKSVAPEIKYPVLIIHGKQDRVIPFNHGKQIANLIPHAQTLWIEDAGHNDIFLYKEVWAKIDSFIKITSNN